MKAIFSVLLIGLLSLSPLVNATSSNMGPRVDCNLSQGGMDYIPVEVCRMNGGSW